MTIKKTAIGVLVSLVIMFVLYRWFDGASISINPLSDAIFFTGVIYFFPGLVSLTGAGRVFTGFDYAARKMFSGMKKDKKFFDSYYDFKIYKESKRLREGEDHSGLTMLVLGILYIAIAYALGALS